MSGPPLFRFSNTGVVGREPDPLLPFSTIGVPVLPGDCQEVAFTGRSKYPFDGARLGGTSGDSKTSPDPGRGDLAGCFDAGV